MLSGVTMICPGDRMILLQPPFTILPPRLCVFVRVWFYSPGIAVARGDYVPSIPLPCFCMRTIVAIQQDNRVY